MILTLKSFYFYRGTLITHFNTNIISLCNTLSKTIIEFSKKTNVLSIFGIIFWRIFKNFKIKY